MRNAIPRAQASMDFKIVEYLYNDGVSKVIPLKKQGQLRPADTSKHHRYCKQEANRVDWEDVMSLFHDITGLCSVGSDSLPDNVLMTTVHPEKNSRKIVFVYFLSSC